MNRNDSHRPPWLQNEPNYYRLLYQIARTKVNEASRLGDSDAETDNHQVKTLMREGSEVARELETFVKDVLNEFTMRRTAWWQLWRPRLRAREKRIVGLLAHTVLPCTRLLIAATLLHAGRAKDADRLVEGIRRPEASGGTLNYRVYYNLACYTVSRTAAAPERHDDEALREAIALLRKSFQLARPSRRDVLVRWAREDPSLALLRSLPTIASEFDLLINRYEAPTPLETAQEKIAR